MSYILSVLQIQINLKKQSNYETKIMFHLSSTRKTSPLNSPIAEDTIKANVNTLHMGSLPEIDLKIDSRDFEAITLNYTMKTEGEYRDQVIPINLNNLQKRVAFLKIIEGRFQGQLEQVYYRLKLSSATSSLNLSEPKTSSKASQNNEADSKSSERQIFGKDSHEQSRFSDVRSNNEVSKVHLLDQSDASFSAQSQRSRQRVDFHSLANKAQPKSENAHQVKTSSSRLSWNMRIVLLLLVVGLIYMVSEMIGDVQEKQEREKTHKKIRKNRKKHMKK